MKNLGINFLIKNLSVKRKIDLGVILILMLITAFTEIITIGSVIPFVAAIINPEKIYEIDILSSFELHKYSSEQLSSYFFFIFILSIIIVTLLNILFIYKNIKFTKKCGFDIAQIIFKNYLNKDYEKILKSNSSIYLSAIIQKTDNVVSVLYQFLLLVINTLILLFITIVLIVFSPIFTIYLFLFFIFLYFSTSFVLKKKLNEYSKDLSKLLNIRNKILNETFKNFRQIFLDNSRNIFKEFFSNYDFKFRFIEARVNFFVHLPRYLYEGIGIVVLSLMAVYLHEKEVFENFDLISYLALLAISAQRALPKINQIYTSWTNISAMKNIVNDVNTLTYFETEKPDEIDQLEINFKESIEFKNISFSYSKNSEKIFKQFNFKIIKGDKFAIKGDSGCGKSTFLDIFLGLLKQQDGEILIDGKVLEKKHIKSHQNKISSVSQFSMFLDASIKENITFNFKKDDIKKEKLELACKTAEIYDFIENLDEKFDTRIGENGVLLSGGQRQRIILARALYRDFDLLLLDEATNALDLKTESKIIENIINLRKDLTIIYVTHKSENVKYFDKVFSMENGRLLEI